MPTPEEIYDAEIAPALLKVAQRCQELGFPMVAMVEYERRVDGGRGRTEFCPETEGDNRPSAAQLLVHYAARCNGNVDSMLFAVMKGARKYGHSSSCLYLLGVPEKPTPVEG